MTTSFNGQRGLIVIKAELFGPSGSVVLRLALDTGATSTMINVGPLTAIGYEPSLVPERMQVTTGSGVEYAPRVPVSRIKALGQERTNFPVLSHTLPPSASIDGLLGLDFLRGRALRIDFRKGRITLN
ncbi:MAG: retropepsin-like aspartic protease [Chloroflexota bacterium]